VRFQDSHSGVLGKKSHLDVGFVANYKVYYKGEGGGFPQVRAVVSLVCPCCPWLVLAPRVLQLCINHFVWVVCRPVWVSEACQFFLVPSWSSNTSLYFSKCYELGSVPRLLPFPLFSTWTHIWVLQGVGNVSRSVLYVICCYYEIMPTKFVLLVQWPPKCLFEWCVPWLSKNLNETSNVVVYEWALNLNIRLGNFNFQIVGIFVMMHYCCFETTLYVFMFHVLFQHIPRIMCKWSVPK
jgi:hypothetical protein